MQISKKIVIKIFLLTSVIFSSTMLFAKNANAQAPLTLSRHEYRMLQEIQNLMAIKNWPEFDKKVEFILSINQSNAPKQLLINLLTTRYKAQGLVERKRQTSAFVILEALYKRNTSLEKQLPNKYLQPLRWQLMYLALSMEDSKYALNMLIEWFENEENPTAPAWYLLASLYTEFNKWQDSKTPIEKAVELDSKNTLYLKLAVNIYYNLKDYNLAISTHKKYMDITSAYDAKSWNLLMQLQLAAEKLEDAVGSLNIIWRNQFNLEVGLFNYLIGSLLQNNQPLEAAKLLRQWLNKNPKAEIKEWKTLLYAELQAKRYKQVEADLAYILGKFKKLKSKDLDVFWQQKANINFRQGNWLEATKDWQNSLPYIKNKKERQKVQLMRVRAFIEADKLEEAKKELVNLLKSDVELIANQAKYWSSYITNLTTTQ